MKIDLHIHSKDGSDGRWSVEAIFQEAAKRGISMISITDHDSLDGQVAAIKNANLHGLVYISGLELNVSFSHPGYRDGKPVSLDFLGYAVDIHNGPLVRKLAELRDYRRKRAEKILENINQELDREGKAPFTQGDLDAIEQTVDGAFGRPHIAGYMVKKGLVANKQQAFDKYLVKCNVPKMPLSLEDASRLVRGAGGKLFLAHPNDPNGTSLISLTSSLHEQHRIIRDRMLDYIDGIECWHSRHDPLTAASYSQFAGGMGLMVSGGSDCHQDPVKMGSIQVPDRVAEQFMEFLP